MNRFEFKKIMKTIELPGAIKIYIEHNGKKEKAHLWENLIIHFGGTDYAVVHGKIPLKVAKTISEKYPDNHYGIRVDGDRNDLKPADRALDYKYQTAAEELGDEWGEGNLSRDEFHLKLGAARNELEGRPIDNKYIECYHIDTKEGLLIFLTEMKDYFSRKNNLPETEVEKYDELLATVTSEILSDVNPSISASEWMKTFDDENKEIYNATASRYDESQYGRTLTKAIKDFDEAVNPFSRKDIKTKEPSDYLKNVTITAYVDKSKKGCCDLTMAIETGKEATYSREADGFSFELQYKTVEGNNLRIRHYFSTPDRNASWPGEVVSVCIYDDKFKKITDIKLNISQEEVTINSDKPVASDLKISNFIMECLEEASEYALQITGSVVKEGQVLVKKKIIDSEE